MNLVPGPCLGEILGTRLPVSRVLLLLREFDKLAIWFSRDPASAPMSYGLLCGSFP